jgi:alcohol dehydrogenase (cytochrome c)
MSAGSILLAVAFLIGLVTLPAHAQQGPTQAELNAAASNAVDWLLTNHDYGGQRFVDAKEITRDNAGSLRAACVYQAGDLRPFHTNPLVYRGVMYLTTSQATIALDAATCRVQWRHFWRPKAKENWPQSRGVALKEGVVIRGTSDGYLLALDALTGRLLWERAAADAERGETFTMPPVVFEDLVIIGPAGNEVPVRGWVGAFRVATGEPVSPLFTAPVNGSERRLVSVVGKDGLLHVLDRESREQVYEVAVTRRENVELPLTPEGVRACPGPLGGVQWNGPAFNPRTNTLYVASVDWCGTAPSGRPTSSST